jgi:streptogramin lyase
LNIKSGLAAALAASLLAACGGGNSSMAQLPKTTPVVPTQPSPVATTSAKSTAQFSITVPVAASGSASSRRPQYVSPNTGSVSISVLSANGVASPVPATVAAIAYGAPGCTSNSSEPLTCSISVSAPTGNPVSFSVSTYQSSNGTGAVLATATISAPVVAGKVNTIPVTLGGVAASIAVSPATLPLVADGQIHIFHLTVNALDASGATIVGSAPLASPVSLSIAGDTNSALQLSTNNVTTPGQPVQLTYTSKIVLNSATITATSGSFTTSLKITPLQVTPTAPKILSGNSEQLTVHEDGFSGAFQVTSGDPSLASITVGATNNGTATVTIATTTTAQGSTTLTIGDGTVSFAVPLVVAPVLFNYFVGGLASTSLIQYITNGPNGKLWFTDQNIAQTAVGVFDPATGFSTEYTSGLQAGAVPNQIVEGPDGNMYFTDDGFSTTTADIGRINPSNGAITEYSVAPSGVTTAICVGPDNNIWFTNAVFGGFQFGVFNPATQATTFYPLPTSTLHEIGSMITGPDGRVWFTDALANAIGVMDPTTHAVTEYTSGLQSFAIPWTMTIGPDGNLWFTDHDRNAAIGKIVPSTGAITEYPITLPTGENLDGIVSSQGKLWVTGTNRSAPAGGGGGSSIGSFDPTTDQYTSYTFGIGNTSSPYALIVGPDTQLWAGDYAMIDQIITH